MDELVVRAGRLEKPADFDRVGKGGVEFSWSGKLRS